MQRTGFGPMFIDILAKLDDMIGNERRLGRLVLASADLHGCISECSGKRV